MKPLFYFFRYLLIVWFFCGVSGCTESKTTQSTSEPANTEVQTITFTDVTAEAGLDEFRYENGALGNMWFPEQMGAGCGFIDYDGDGWLDILLVGGGAFPGQEKEFVFGLWLYRNNGDGTFSLKSDEAGLGNVAAYGLGISVADYDKDGDQDFYFTTLRENMLFRNNDGIFEEVGKQAGVSNQSVWSASAIFFDADRDGWLDLYVANYADWSPETDIRCSIEGHKKVYCPPGHYKGIPSRYYRNNGDGTFTDLTESAGFFENAPGKSLGIAELDYNKDGWPDLVVANDGEGDLLYKNNRDGTFTERGMISGMAYGENGEARAGMGIDVGVVDNSGKESIFIGNFEQEMIGVYKYVANGLFMSRSAISKIGRPSINSLTFGVFLCDLDLDGDLDFFAANGHVYILRLNPNSEVAYRQQSQLFLNRGDGIFDEANQIVKGPLLQKMVARGAVYGDYDRDGDPDILIIENGESGGPVHLWRNDLHNGQFLRVRLEGNQSNRDGIGSHIIAVIGDKHMERRIRTGSSYLSQSEKAATFGLGEATKVDSLMVYWPSGQVDSFVGVESNQEIHIVEGSGTFEQRPLPGNISAAGHTSH